MNPSSDARRNKDRPPPVGLFEPQNSPNISFPKPKGRLTFDASAKVGKGGFGEVRKYSDANGFTYAIKFINQKDPMAVARFEREERIMRLLRTKNEKDYFLPLITTIKQ